METLSLLRYLLPNFAALGQDDPQGLAALFWIGIMLILVLSLFFVVLHFLRFRKRWSQINQLLEGQQIGTLAANRRSTLQAALKMDNPQVGNIWREFDESLVLSSDGASLHNTLDADHFFNARTLAQGLTGSRLLAAAPSFLVALGVLGTFVGLTVGLVQLDINSDSDVNVLRNGINGLIQGAAVAFMTSVWGIGCSLLLNFVEKMFERSALNRITGLQHRIDFLYPRLPAEQSLVSIADSSRQAKEALQELHERIGDRLQESFTGFAGVLQTTLTDTLNGIMKPAIDSLVQHSSDQSTTALEQLVNKFMAGMGESGKAQAELLNSSAQGLQNVVNNIDTRLQDLTQLVQVMQSEQHKLTASHGELADKLLKDVLEGTRQNQGQLHEQFQHMLGALQQQFSQLQSEAHGHDETRRQQLDEQVNALTRHQGDLLDAVSKGVSETQEQSRRMAEQHNIILQELGKVSTAMAESSLHMDNSAKQLGLLANKVESASTLLGSRLTEIADRVESALAETAHLTATQKEQSQAMLRLQDSISATMTEFRDAAQLTRTAVEALKQRQEELLRETRMEFSRLGDTLREQVLQVENQAKNWLESYSNQVGQQVNERMQEWNRHSLQYANEMLRISQGLGSVLDELEARRS